MRSQTLKRIFLKFKFLQIENLISKDDHFHKSRNIFKNKRANFGTENKQHVKNRKISNLKEEINLVRNKKSHKINREMPLS